MSDQPSKNKPINSPFLLLPILLGVAMLFATIMWFGARRETAALYGIIRSIEFPWVNRFVPHMEHFQMEPLRDGTVPAFWMIYENSFVFGLFFTALILLVMMFALMRLDKFSIMRHIKIKSDKGRTYREVMERMAENEPSVRFFLDYNILSLPTTEGTARQPLKADELLLYTNTIKHIQIDKDHSSPPTIEIDRQKLRSWMVARFGPENPFIDISKRRLLNVSEIRTAVDDLSWYGVLILYPALHRIHAFYVEDKEGYETTRDEIDAFISGIWTEINGFKREFGDGIELGFASEADREERNALYRAGKTEKGRKKRNALDAEAGFEESEGSTVIDNMSELGRWFRRGRIDRGEIEADAIVQKSSAGPEPAKKGIAPEHLLFFGEVLSERGPNLKSVQKARDGLKDILTRHLGSQTKRYPTGTDPKTGIVTYAPRITNAQQKAFNTKAQERLANAEQAIEKVLFRHQFEFSVVGGALETTRKYGIMPPNLFRWLRFSEETTPFWWFVQNLGMPAAYPENAGLYEHYQAEKAMDVAIEQPHIHSAIEGIQREANRYLVADRIAELRSILGREAIVKEVVRQNFVGNVMEEFDKMIANAAEGKETGNNATNSKKHRSNTHNRETAPQTDDDQAATKPRKVATRDSLLSEFDLDDD